MAEGKVFDIKNGVLKKYNNSSESRVIIPDGVAKIEKGAFSDCENLTSINIPGSVKDISDEEFQNCKELTVISPRGSYAWEKYSTRNTKGISTKPRSKRKKSENKHSIIPIIVIIIFAVILLRLEKCNQYPELIYVLKNIVTAVLASFIFVLVLNIRAPLKINDQSVHSICDQ